MAINARAERLLNIEAHSLVYETYFITSAFDYNLSFWRRIPILKWFLPYCVLFWACRKYQRFHFYCDRGLLPQTETFFFNLDELRLLRDLGKEVYVWTYGADVRTQARTKSLGAPNACVECPQPGRHCVCSDDTGRAAQARLREYVTAVFSMGDMLEYTPGSRTDVFFWPVDLQAEGGKKYAPYYPEAGHKAALRVVHAPNHRFFKGTHFLMEAVDQLKREGVDIELVFVERVPNAQALEIYRTADVVFDQCLIGFHGYFANEAMALGKPVMAFIRRPDEYLLHPEECPILNSPPERIAPILRELAGDRHRVRELGMAGRRYIEKYYTMEAFAERLGRVYKELAVASPVQTVKVSA